MAVILKLYYSDVALSATDLWFWEDFYLVYIHKEVCDVQVAAGRGPFVGFHYALDGVEGRSVLTDVAQVVKSKFKSVSLVAIL